MSSLSPTLVVVHDRHAARDLERMVRQVAAGNTPPLTLTHDVLLGLRLRHLGLRVRLTIDGLSATRCRELDEIALNGVAAAYGGRSSPWLQDIGLDYAQTFEYPLIPRFMRAVRHIWSVTEALDDEGAARVVIVGTGELCAAAALVARHRGLPIDRMRTGAWRRITSALARARAGRHVRWVNTELRALVLEPGFLAMMMLRPLWSCLSRTAAATAAPYPARSCASLIVTGDRFTRILVDRLRGQVGHVVVAGGTQPGRRAYGHDAGSTPIEALARISDLARAFATVVRSLSEAVHTARTRPPLSMNGVAYWPLVRRVVSLHLIAWSGVLAHLRVLTGRAARLTSAGALLVSNDVTPYNRLLLAAAHAAGVPSIGLQHGMLAEFNGHSTARVRVLAAWGRASEQWYSRHAPQDARFVVTGSPHFDLLAGRLHQRPFGALRRPAGFRIAILTGFVAEYSVSASEYENLGMIDAVLTWTPSAPDVDVVLKPHPGEEPEYYESAAKALGWPRERLTIARDAPLYELIESVDVVVAYYSTTVLEAAALGTPAVVFDATARYVVPLDRLRDVTIAFTRDALHATLTRLRDTKSARRNGGASDLDPCIREYLDSVDGGATDRVCALVSAELAGARV